jgi:hypothetical protein
MCNEASGCSAVGDDNVSVAHSIVGASHILGWHMLPESWVSLVLPRIAGSGTTPVQVSYQTMFICFSITCAILIF